MNDDEAERAFNERFSGVSKAAQPANTSGRSTTPPKPENCLRCNNALIGHEHVDLALSSKFAAWFGDVKFTALRVFPYSCLACGHVEFWSPTPANLRVDTFDGKPKK